MSEHAITVLSVSWHSAAFLRAMLGTLLSLAAEPDAIRVRLADNTGGADGELQTLQVPDRTIVPVDVRGERMSMAHALGLNALVPQVVTPYTLIIDPDVMILRRDWDRDLCAALQQNDRVAIGAPYPRWKLGKYHDFPSPPFALWRTEALQALAPDWRPYARSAAQRLADFALRQAYWVPRAVDRWLLRLPPRRFNTAHWAERLTGVVSKDTGWEIAQRARRRGWRAQVFDVVDAGTDADTLPQVQRATYRALASEFELYSWRGQPIVTHRNPTLTRLDFNLWTHRNVLIYQSQTDNAAQTARWQALIAELGLDHPLT